jgi:hypothetical protein
MSAVLSERASVRFYSGNVYKNIRRNDPNFVESGQNQKEFYMKTQVRVIIACDIMSL